MKRLKFFGFCILLVVGTICATIWRDANHASMIRSAAMNMAQTAREDGGVKLIPPEIPVETNNEVKINETTKGAETNGITEFRGIQTNLKF